MGKEVGVRFGSEISIETTVDTTEISKVPGSDRTRKTTEGEERGDVPLEAREGGFGQVYGVRRSVSTVESGW